MLPIPQPSSNAKGSRQWEELVLDVDSLTWPSLENLIEEFWPKAVSYLGTIRDIDIAGPMDKAWFHIRRAVHGNRADVLRLRNRSVSDQNKNDILALGINHNNPTWAKWCPNERHDNAFLSFLQKLSVLRARDRIFYNGFLGQTPQTDYDKDSQCQEAYRIMTAPNSKWYVALKPWFNYMSSTCMDSYRTHEYAHWFGHILSGWK